MRVLVVFIFIPMKNFPLPFVSPRFVSYYSAEFFVQLLRAKRKVPGFILLNDLTDTLQLEPWNSISYPIV